MGICLIVLLSLLVVCVQVNIVCVYWAACLHLFACFGSLNMFICCEIGCAVLLTLIIELRVLLLVVDVLVCNHILFGFVCLFTFVL